jgi:leader peptidase (prepilin peptidase)/N-methyltransferase
MLDLQWVAALMGGLLGLMLGSFLNVVVYRLPIIMERQWAADYAEMQGTETALTEPFNLSVPRSRCPHCGHPIRWFENIPVASYAVLRGACSACRAPISPRYPAVEIATGALCFFCLWHWGPTTTGLAWCGFSAALLCLALIDWDTTLLPDDITFPLLWAGLIGSSLHWTGVPLFTALWGAVAGYLSLWSIYWIFKLVTGKEGMGYGDFKLFAALGAWFGWEALLPMILMASVVGAVIGIAMKFSTGLREGGYIPFGPFLASAGLTAMVFGPNAILQLVGL